MDATLFWRELNDDFYRAYPPLWEEGPLYADGEDFVAILNGETNVFRRRKTEDERLTKDAIVRADRKIWEVGRVYYVRAERWVEPVLGQIKLVAIDPTHDPYLTELMFEIVRKG